MATLALVKLANRRLLKISGPDCYPYLQGLLSNDIRYLYEPDRIPKRKHAIGSVNALSSFMLNAQGRAICDLILYRTPLTRNECEFSPPGQAKEPDELLIECDSSFASGLANTLYGYRVRRKISVSIEDSLSVWCLFPKLQPEVIRPNEATALVNLNTLKANEILTNDLTVVMDPRLTDMGLRIITRGQEFLELKRSIQSVINQDIIEASNKSYLLHRYSLGIGEGVQDHPESNCFPLECNGDFLGSISFTKGCYLGQELTARTHYTGVVRKRLMPIILDLKSANKEQETLPLLDGSDIIVEGTTKTKKVGIIRHVAKNRGLALLRHELVNDSNQLIHEGSKTKLAAYKPYWWDAIKSE